MSGGDAEATDVVWVPVEEVCARYVPGSFDQPWTWDDEERDLFLRECCCRSHQCETPSVAAAGHYQRALEAFIAEHGMPPEPICLGNDGRVWDGHHRIVAARRLGMRVAVAVNEWTSALAVSS